MPSLSRDVRRVHAVADRLLVAVAQARHPADPLEAGERLDTGDAGGLGHRPEQPRRDDRTREHGVGALRVHSASEHVRAQEDAHLVAAEHPPAGGVGRRWRRPVGHGDRAAVGVGVAGDDDVGVDTPGEREGQVDCAGLLGVRERDGREVRVGRGLLLDDERPRETGPRERTQDDLAADAVHGGVDDATAPGGSRGRRRRRRRRDRRRRPPRRGRSSPRPPAATEATDSTASMRAAISMSAGGTIWPPSPR